MNALPRVSAVAFLSTFCWLDVAAGVGPVVQWERALGGTRADWGRSVQHTSDGGYIIAGTTYSFIEPATPHQRGGTPSEVYLVKTDSVGNVQWEKSFGLWESNRGAATGYAVVQTFDGGYVVAGDMMGIGLVKTDSAGNIQWDKAGEEPYATYLSVRQTSDGGYIIVGHTSDGILLLKADPAGNTEWTKTYGRHYFDECHSVQQTPEGGYIIVGTMEWYTTRGKDIYVIKTDSDGNVEWQKTYGSDFNDGGREVCLTSDGGYVVTGHLSGGAGLIKIDSAGRVRWEKTYGAPEGNVVRSIYGSHGRSVQQTSDAGYIVAGSSNFYSKEYEEAYVVKTDSEGNAEWEETFGGAGSAAGESVDVTSDGGYIICGSTGAEGLDVYLLKLGGTADIGSLQVTIEPQDAIASGAQWRRAGTLTWHDSGDVETGVPVGEHTIEFKAVPSFTAPSDQAVTIADGEKSNCIGIYTDGDAIINPFDAEGSLLGTITGAIRVNHLGWRPGDPKAAILRDRPQTAVELRRRSDNSIVGSYTSGDLKADEDSGDNCALLDFSEIDTPDHYYLYLPSLDERSYSFRIAKDVYAIAGAAAMKSFYFQRCNHERVLPYASDALGRFAGIDGQWLDGACHLGDHQAAAAPAARFLDHGPLDLRGGWHDAGDYQKTLWGRGVAEMLWAFEFNPEVWNDGQLNIPESGNGIPDLLDELAWELDFYLRMQRPDGHFLTSVKHNSDTTSASSPPSACTGERVYFDGTAPKGNGWSGGGTSTVLATANAVRCLAHAAIVFDNIGESTKAYGYREAALKGWAWLNVATPTSPAKQEERHAKCAAAAAVYRVNPADPNAKYVVESFPWQTWDGNLLWSVTPCDTVRTSAAWHYLSHPDANEAIKATIRDALRAVVVDGALAEEGIYGGMYGDSENAWDWSWGSNRAQAMYGANLFAAARFGAQGNHSVEDIERLAFRYVHYLLGINPLNMLYMTNMAAYGGEHSSFQIFHGWFSHTGVDGDQGNKYYNGKPPDVNEPMYPYYPEDFQESLYGPAPGLLPGGPNLAYDGTYSIPNRQYPAYAYRDWSVGCDWRDGACRSRSWQITEPSCRYQGALVLLLSFVMPEVR